MGKPLDGKKLSQEKHKKANRRATRQLSETKLIWILVIMEKDKKTKVITVRINKNNEWKNEGVNEWTNERKEVKFTTWHMSYS